MESLFTIGYEGKTIDQFVTQLKANRIGILVDVRKNPISRRPGFSKSKLRAACEKASIDYIHFPELGVPSERREDLKTDQDRQELWDWYDAAVIPHHHEQLQQILQMSEKKRVALTCFEAKPHECHRSRVAVALKEIETDLKIRDI